MNTDKLYRIFTRLKEYIIILGLVVGGGTCYVNCMSGVHYILSANPVFEAELVKV